MAQGPPGAIVIFGAAVRPDGQPSATLRNRVDAALRCAAAWPDCRVIPTGAKGRFGPPEAIVMRDLLCAGGVAAGRILPETTGTDTLSSVRAVRRLLRAQRISGPVLVATSAYHLPRCLVLLRLAGIAARGCPPPPGPASGRFRWRWYWRLRELPALPYDAALVLLLRLMRRL